MLKFRNENGSVLVLTVITFSLLSILGLALVPLSLIELKSSQSFSDYEKSYSLAEAGLEDSISRLSENDNWDSLTTYDKDLGDGSFSITISGDESTKIITSTGKIGSISRTLETTVSKNDSQQYNLLDIAESHALFANKSMFLTKGATIYGNINVYGDFSVKKNKLEGKGTIYANSFDGNYEYNDKIDGFTIRLGAATNINQFDIDEYKLFVTENRDLQDKIEDTNYYYKSSESSPKIFIGSNLVKKSTYYGIVILDNAAVNFNDVEINGILITNANSFKFTGHGLTVNGALVCVGNGELGTNQGNYKFIVNHEFSTIENYNSLLHSPLNYLVNGSNSSTGLSISGWRETD